MSEGCIYFPGFEFAHLPAVALVSGLVLRCQRRCVYLLFIQPSRTGTAWRAPGPCSALDRQLRGDFSTHLGLGSLWGSSRVRLGAEKVKEAGAMFWPEDVMSSMFALKPALWAKRNSAQKISNHPFAQRNDVTWFEIAKLQLQLRMRPSMFCIQQRTCLPPSGNSGENFM